MKRKILNDPIYGFININSDLIFDIIDHPYFQRLRRIKQLGLTDLVYPGALHTRFHHAIGAMHLMGEALKSIRQKGHEISNIEIEQAQIAILLHDIGHGPFSHVLEHHLLPGVQHEALSILIMKKLNQELNGSITIAIDMFENRYERPFFNQLISSQLDIDRLDYLNRDSFFSGVTEASIGAERIIKMLDLVDEKIVVEQKAIYSIENFLNSRRFMYWQVYLHKTALSAEIMLVKIVERAKDLVQKGFNLELYPSIGLFITNNIDFNVFQSDPQYLNQFLELDDIDIWANIKLWKNSKDPILSKLCLLLLDRKLFKIELSDKNFNTLYTTSIKSNILNHKNADNEMVKYFFEENHATNSAYQFSTQNINILTKSGKIVDISEASDLPTIKALGNIVKKYYVCYIKDVYL